MKFKGRAIYNLLKLSSQDEPCSEAESWQIANYREISSSDLFKNLKDLGIHLDEKSFLLYGETCEAPEDMLDCIWLEDDSGDEYEKAFLIIFELWRRLLPQKQSISIFADELDNLIFLFDKQALEDEELLQKAISDLEDILDEGADAGSPPEEIFKIVSQFCAHDLEAFLYDYIIDQMDCGNETYASELLDGFYDYITEKKWFDFLKARLFYLANSEESDFLLLGLLEQQDESPDLELSFEICRFVVNRGDIDIFKRAADQLLKQISLEEDFKSFLDLLAEFHRCLDRDQNEMAIKDIIDKRQHLSDDYAVSDADKQLILSYL